MATLGDVGRLDEAGYLYLTDRQSNMIISGGVNIYPQEAENVLAGHPKVFDVAVIGIPNPEFGEEVLAVVQPAEGVAGTDEDADELIAACAARLSKIKCPRTVEFRADLPREPNGKLLKRKLRDEYWGARASRLV
jgi:fatty-acyl-CoA synthase